MNAASSPIAAVFVYGTLKRGQCRDRAWPVAPQNVRPAFVRGILWGRDDYPALLPGDGLVLGELWRFAPGDMAIVLTKLDEIEGTEGNSPHDLYHRREVEVCDQQGQVMQTAFTYFYNRNPLADGFERAPEVDGIQCWPMGYNGAD